jgi:hypothetical protein
MQNILIRLWRMIHWQERKMCLERQRVWKLLRYIRTNSGHKRAIEMGGEVCSIIEQNHFKPSDFGFDSMEEIHSLALASYSKYSDGHVSNILPTEKV